MSNSSCSLMSMRSMKLPNEVDALRIDGAESDLRGVEASVASKSSSF